MSHLTPTSLAFQQSLHALTNRLVRQGFDTVTAGRQALADIYRSVQTQAAMLSYLDIFKILMFYAIVAGILTLFLKKIDLSKARAH